MVYGYIRVSSDRQTLLNQRFELERFAQREGMTVDAWFEETISGTKDFHQRQLGKLLRQVRAGDLVLCSELSRLGRSLFMIMDILSRCMERGCSVWTVRDGYRLGEDMTSKVLAFAFGLSAEIERNLISQRTREALARLRAEGRTLGRPLGARSKRLKLTGQEERIREALQRGQSRCSLARELAVSLPTLRVFIRNNRLAEPEKS